MDIVLVFMQVSTKGPDKIRPFVKVVFRSTVILGFPTCVNTLHVNGNYRWSRKTDTLGNRGIGKTESGKPFQP